MSMVDSNAKFVRKQVGFTDNSFEINNLSVRRRVFTDKITFYETMIIRNCRSAHKINAVSYEEWDNSEMD